MTCMRERLVVLTTTAGPGQATILKQALEAAGIPAELSQESAGPVYGLTVGPLGLVDILVRESDAAAAGALLETLESDEANSDSASDT